ncbi:unnamed protein product [Gongylonema pulchrum]|uniref:Glycine cleavage system H protein n=1 Tax=Gongylonema pulchrum TaxID=637853 RepID=A0A183DFU9_9BILA|nr:unnamed protein product [Gongylonema pulchrum]
MTALWAQLALRRIAPLVISSESFFAPICRTITTSNLLYAVFVDRYYTKKHEWVIIEGNTATVGISDFAQGALGDIVYAELPEIGKELKAGDSAGAIESVKAASDVYSPVSGTVTEKNKDVEDNPALINKSAFDEGELLPFEAHFIVRKKN